VNGGSYSVAHALVDAGADLNLADHGGFTPLYLCSDDELTEKLIVNGADVNTHELHETPLMAACRSGQEKKVSLLLSHGADASLADSSELNLGWSPLMLACARNHVPVTKMLLTALRASGGSANSKMSDGQTALHIAVQHSSTDCVEALLEAGVEIDVNDDGESPLHSVSDVSILRMLLKAGARDGKDSSGLTALMRACADDRLDLVNVFLEHQPPVDTTKTSTSTDTNTDIGVWSPLLLAANKSYLDIMRVLLPVEDVNFKNSSGHTALSIAARKSQPLAVKLLLDSRADPLITDKLGRTALMLAGYNLEVVKMLVDSAPEMLGFLDHRGRSTIACFCACSSSYDVLHELFTHCDRYKIDAQVNAKHDNKDTAFHWAMMGSNERAASLLLSKGAEVLNVGYMDTTVLMKPLLDEEMRSRYVGPRSLDSAVSPDDQQLADAAANACLRLVLEHIACGGASGEAEVRIPATGRGGDAGGVGEEPAAKRRRL
jgi:ankyrin repeat protein